MGKETQALANHKSAIKRARQNEIRNLRNKSNRTRVKNAIKAVRGAIEAQSQEKAQTALTEAVPAIRKAANKGAIHRKNASKKISRLTKQVNALPA